MGFLLFISIVNNRISMTYVLKFPWHGYSTIYIKKDGRDEKVRAKVLQSINRSYLCCISGTCCCSIYPIRNGKIIS
jgi:hypothetical protein